MRRACLLSLATSWASTALASECDTSVAQPPSRDAFEANSAMVCAAWPAREDCAARDVVPDRAGALAYFEARWDAEPCVAYYAYHVATLLEWMGRRVEAHTAYERLAALDAPSRDAIGEVQREAMTKAIEAARERIPLLEQRLSLLQLEPAAGAVRVSQLNANVALSQVAGRRASVQLRGTELIHHLEGGSPLVLEPGDYSLDLEVAGCPQQREALRLRPGRSSRALLGLKACEPESEPTQWQLLTRLDAALHSEPGGALRAGVSYSPSRRLLADAAWIAAPHNGGGWLGLTYFPFPDVSGLSLLGVELGAIGLLPWPGSANEGELLLGAEAALTLDLPWDWSHTFAGLGVQHYLRRERERYSPSVVLLSVGSRWELQ